ATKTSEQQSGLVLHRTRHLFIRQQTAVINAIRAHLAEFGIVHHCSWAGLRRLSQQSRTHRFAGAARRLPHVPVGGSRSAATASGKRNPVAAAASGYRRTIAAAAARDRAAS